MEITQTASSNHHGLVTGLDGDTAIVRFTRGKMCAHCGACLAAGETHMETRVVNVLHAKIGDTVEVVIAPKKIVRASLLAYCVPLLFLLIGVWIGQMISDLWSGILGIGLSAAAFLLLRLVEPRFKRMRTFEPKMTSILSTGNSMDGGD